MLRRQFIQSSAALIGAGATATLNLQQPAEAQPSPSTTIANQFISAAVLLTNKQPITAYDIRAFAATAGIFFAYMTEIGATAQLQAAMLKSGMLDTPPSFELYESMYPKITALGMKVDRLAFNNFYQTLVTELSVLKVSVENQGSAAILQNFVQLLVAMAAQMEQNGGQLARVRRPYSNVARSIPARPAGWNFCAAISVAGLYTATWGVMASAEVIAATFIAGPAFAIAGLGIAVLGVACV